MSERKEGKKKKKGKTSVEDHVLVHIKGRDQDLETEDVEAGVGIRTGDHES